MTKRGSKTEALSEWFLGSLSAELDHELWRYFLDDRPGYRRALDMDDPHCILVGRTGIGKSAILTKIREDYSGNSKIICPGCGSEFLNFASPA